MSKRFAAIAIDDIEGNAAAQTALIELFENTMRSLTRTLVRSATLHTDDFHGAGQRGLAGFELLMDRRTVEGTEFWDGVFSRGDEHLRVTGHFE